MEPEKYDPKFIREIRDLLNWKTLYNVIIIILTIFLAYFIANANVFLKSIGLVPTMGIMSFFGFLIFLIIFWVIRRLQSIETTLFLRLNDSREHILYK